MSKILVIGYLPPELCRQEKIEAANYRTGQFIQPLIEDGHNICLCAQSSLPKGDLLKNLPESWKGLFSLEVIQWGKTGWPRQLQDTHDRFQPDCIIAVNFYQCLFATKLQTRLPIWMDIYGDILTVMQAVCYRAKSNRGMPTAIAFLREIIHRGDKFSVCSSTQRHMMVGELAVAGRLNWQNFGYEFTEVVPAGMVTEEPVFDGAGAAKFRKKENIGEKDFVILWCGGYNIWTDVKTLFTGLEWAMQNNSALHFVSAGASTYEAPDNVYIQFQDMIDKSPFKNRFHLLGWRPWNELSTYYQAANAAVNIDAFHYETVYGTRTRLLEMIVYHLPIITSLGTELSYILQREDAALTFEIGSWQQLGEQILSLAGNPERCKNLAMTASRYASQEFTFKATTKAVRKWACDPALAPDRISPNRDQKRKDISHRARSLIRLFFWHLSGQEK